MKTLNKSKGFTIIELIVVIAIISILAAIIIIGVNQYIGKARDATRKADLQQLKTALEAYYSEHMGYPATPNNWWCTSDQNDNEAVTYCGDYIPNLKQKYIGSLPMDPLGGDSTNPICGGFKRSFLYMSNGINFKLLSHCAPEGSWDSSDPFYDPVRSTWAYMVCSRNLDPTSADPNDPDYDCKTW